MIIEEVGTYRKEIAVLLERLDFLTKKIRLLLGPNEYFSENLEKQKILESAEGEFVDKYNQLLTLIPAMESGQRNVLAQQFEPVAKRIEQNINARKKDLQHEINEVHIQVKAAIRKIPTLPSVESFPVLAAANPKKYKEAMDFKKTVSYLIGKLTEMLQTAAKLLEHEKLEELKADLQLLQRYHKLVEGFS